MSTLKFWWVTKTMDNIVYESVGPLVNSFKIENPFLESGNFFVGL